MKRFIVAISLIILVVATGIVSLWHAGYSCDVLTGQVAYMQNESVLENDELRARELAELINMWSERKEWLIHHVHHGSMDEIGSALSRAIVFSEAGELLHLRAELAELYWLFHSFRENEAITLDNIF